MMNNPGNPVESPNKANTPQNPANSDQYDLNPSYDPRWAHLSLPNQCIEMRETPNPGVHRPLQYPSQFQHQVCPYHGARTLHAPVNPPLSPHDYQNPRISTPPFQPNPDPYQHRPQPFHSNVENLVQDPRIGCQSAPRAHHIHMPKTSLGHADQMGADDNSDGSSEVQFVCEIRRADLNKGAQGSASKGLMTAHFAEHPSEKGNPSSLQSKDEISQPSADPTKQLTVLPRLTEDHSTIQIAPRHSDKSHLSFTEKRKASLGRKARRTSKRRKKTPQSKKMTGGPTLTERESTGQKKERKRGIRHKKSVLFTHAPTEHADSSKKGPMSSFKEPHTRNVIPDQASPVTCSNTVVPDNNPSDLNISYGRKGRKDLPRPSKNVMEASSKDATIRVVPQRKSTDGNPVHNPSENSSVMKSCLGRKRYFDDITSSETPYSSREMTKIMQSQQEQKRSRQDGIALSHRNAHMKTVEHRQGRNRKKSLDSSILSKGSSQHCFEIMPEFLTETQPTENLKTLTAEAAIPTLTPFPRPIPSTPEPLKEDETDDEHDQNELESRFGEIKDGYIWHYRSGWVMHPSYFQRKNFKLCVMHRACKHRVDCQTTRFQMAIISCARNKLTPRELQFLWGTSRVGVAKFASTFKGMPVKYLLVPVKHMK